MKRREEMLKRKRKSDVVELGKKTSTNKHNVNIEQQMENMAGDVGRISIEKQEKKPHKQTKISKASKAALRSKTAKIQSLRIPKTVQESMPYDRVYLNGIIKTGAELFTKCYKLTDANFRTANQEAQDEMYFNYGDLLNYFSPDVRPQFIIFNRSVDKEKFKSEILIAEKDDEYNDMRRDLNQILLDKISEGQNNITQEKYLVVSVKAENIEIAVGIFARIDGELATRIKTISEATTEPMTLEERLELLYNIYNQDTDVPFFRKMNIDGNDIRSFDINWMHQLGLTTKDIIGPTSILVEDSYFKLGGKYGRSLFLKNLPTQLSADIYTDLANIPCNALTSVHFSPMRQDSAIRLVRDQMLEINQDMARAAKRAAKNGLGTDFISPELRQAKKDADKSYDDITVRDQKSILMTFVITVFADDLDELDKYTKMVQNNAEKHLCTLAKLTGQQERGLNSCLPLGENHIWADRLMNTESAALFTPYESQELVQPDGQFYGVNAISNHVIVINRLQGQNSNGLIFGMSGSGKSMAAKFIMSQVALLPEEKNEILVIDPQSEYHIIKEFGGEVIRIAPGSHTHINPFDLDISTDSTGDDPVTIKSDYIASICECAIGGHFGLNPIQISVIDRCVRRLYDPYIAHMDMLRRTNSTITCDRSKSPTFRDFYELLKRQPEPEAEYIRLSIEKYCVGSYNTFSFPTNINTSSRFLAYDIHDIGTGMYEIGMQVCLNDIRNRTIANHKRGIRTWIFIDELYVLTQSERTARFLMYCWKQLRKAGAILTAMTQNVEDLLTNREARGIINNSPFIMLLNQSSEDRTEIGAMLHISEAQLSYIKNADTGQGLIYYGDSIVPFKNKIPKSSKLYKLISTNPNETNQAKN